MGRPRTRPSRYKVSVQQTKTYTIPANTAFVERRFLLFQLDFSDPALQEYLSFNPFTNQKDSSFGGTPFKFLDPLEYEDPSSPLYWRNVIDPSYAATFKSTLETFRKNFFQLVRDGKFRLRQTGFLPFRDISPFVKVVNGYSVAINDFSNSISLDIGDPKTLSSFGVKSPVEAPGSESLTQNLDIKENDIIMVRVSRDNGTTFQPEFLGLVTKVKNTSSYGQVNDFNVQVDGVSKNFYVTSVIKQGAVRSDQFLPGVEVSSPTEPSVFQDNFNNLDTGQIFSSILDTILGMVKQPVVNKLNSGEFQNYIYNSDLFNGTDKRGFQSNILILLTMYLMQTTPVDYDVVGFSNLFPKTSTQNPTTPLLDTPARAYLQHGEHKTYNLMISDGFQNFFSQLAKPAEILGDVRTNSFYELFEQRNGTLVCRPPRYNKIEINISDVETFGVRTIADIDKIFVATQVVEGGNPNTVYKFNPSADFYIGEQHQATSIDVERNDLELESRADTQFVMPTVGVAEYPAGNYTDPNLLVKYGLRARGPINNPNVLNPNLAKLFAPIVLGIGNAQTRTVSATLWDSRDYRVPKLYYIASENLVAYAVGSTILPDYGTVSAINVQMVMTRHVIERKISDILKTQNEILNFAMCYLVDFSAVPKTDPRTPSQIKSDLIQSATLILQAMLDSGGEGSKVQMFKYVPNILDLIADIEQNPSLSAKDSDTTQTKVQAATDQAKRKSVLTEAIDVSGQFYASDLVTEDGGRAYSPSIFSAIADAMNAVRPDQRLVAAFPGAGAYHYNLSTAGPAFRRSFGLVGHDFENSPAISTPITVDDISASPESFLFSQFLTNRLASLDLGMKYKSDSLLNNSLTFNEKGFPQLYTAVNGSYRLFGSTDAPRDYLNYLMATVGGASPKVRSFQNDLFNSPNALKIDLRSTQLSNAFLKIGSMDGKTYNLPAGHFVWTIPSPNTETTSLNFVFIPGGRYTLSSAGLTAYTIQALGAKNYVNTDISETTPAANFQAPVSGVDIATGASLATYTEVNKTLTIEAPSGLYFISPYTDLSLERILEFGLTPALAGYRKDSDVASLTKSSNKALLGDNDLHTKGQGFDFCPEVLLKSSGSDLEAVLAPGGLAVSQPIFARMISLIQSQGFKTSDRGSLLVITHDSININWSYVDNTPGKTLPANAYFHLGVTDKEVKQGMDKLVPGVSA